MRKKPHGVHNVFVTFSNDDDDSKSCSIFFLGGGQLETICSFSNFTRAEAIMGLKTRYEVMKYSCFLSDIFSLLY